MRSSTVTTRAERVTAGLVVPGECSRSIPCRCASQRQQYELGGEPHRLDRPRAPGARRRRRAPHDHPRRTVGAASRAAEDGEAVGRSVAARSAASSSRAYVSEPPTAPGTRYSRLRPTCTASSPMIRRQAVRPGERRAERRRAASTGPQAEAEQRAARSARPRYPESSSAVSARANAAADPAARLFAQPLAQQPRQRAERVRRWRAASARPPAGGGATRQRELGGQQRRGHEQQQRARVGATIVAQRLRSSSRHLCSPLRTRSRVDARRRLQPTRPPPSRRRSDRSTSSQYMK